MNYTAQQIAEVTDANLIGNQSIKVSSIAFDSRNIFSSENIAFVAIKTPYNNGEKYILEAIEKGVSVIIAEKQTEDVNGITWLIVKNSVQAIQMLAKYHLENHHLKTIGITGSNGKTIVKEWLYQALWGDLSVVKSPKSFNSQIGLPISLLQINSDNELGIFEVGISKPKEMDVLENIFSPEIGVLTNIGSAHSVNFSSESALIDEKIKLFKHSNCIIFNGDNKQVYSKIKALYSSKKLISFGFKSRNDVFVKNKWKDDVNDLIVNFFNEEITLSVEQRHEANILNRLSVLCVLKELGFENGKIVEKINLLKPVEMRLESMDGVRNNLIINDYYNLDIDSLTIALQFIQQYQKIEKTLILTDIIDVKYKPETLYKMVAELVNEQNFKQIFLIGGTITSFQKLFKALTYTFKDSDELVNSQHIKNIENQLVLLKGARNFEIEKIKRELELQKHDTTLEINLNAILHNINVHKGFLNSETKIMAMVKAYSYGLGGYEIAEFLQHHHIDYLGVAYADEGVELRKNGITKPIMVMNPEQNAYDTIISYKLEPEIYSFRVLELFREELLKKGVQEQYPIHIKLETGMHRLGFKEDEIDHLIEWLNKNDLKVVSIFSHLSSSDDPHERDYTLTQISLFEKIATRISDELGYKPIFHILNSSGITNYPEYQFDMVRIGIGMLGYSSNSQIKSLLQNVVKFKTKISQISSIKKDDSIGYNRKYISNSDTRIATIPVGYADGVPRLLSNKNGFLGVEGNLVPIVGNICMDMLMVDIGDLGIKEGDGITIFGDHPSLEDFSNYSKTIPYEVLTSISRRVKRIYIKD